MKYIYIDEYSANFLINDRTFQSIEFEKGRQLVNFFRGILDDLYISTEIIALKYEADCLYILAPQKNPCNYIVFDLEEASSILDLNDSGVLLIIQKTLRFNIKLWNGHPPSKNEKITQNNKAVIFPYPIGFQTSIRLSIDRNPDERRRNKRELQQANLIYKCGTTEGDGPTETPRYTNFRKSIEKRPFAIKLAESRLILLNTSPVNNSILNVTQLQKPETQINTGGFNEWKRWLTISQKTFIESNLLNPHRIEGPAGTGKTLCLALKSIYTLEESRNKNIIHKSLFLAHSQSTKKAIINQLIQNKGESYLEKIEFSETSKPQSIVVTTLHELCSYLLRKDISETELVDKDAYESKITQQLYAFQAVDIAQSKHLTSHKPYMSDELIKFLEESDQWEIAEILQHEISVQIKGRANQDFTQYKKLPCLKIGFPIKNDGDKSFIYIMYEEYQIQLEYSAQFDTDDVVLSAISQLATPIWRRRRIREGFDSIFIDETHLFNINELSIFHKLTRKENNQPIAYSVDRSQALGDRGWMSSQSFAEIFDPTHFLENDNPTTVKSIFRCSPEITNLAFSVTTSGATLFTNFHNPLTDVVSAFSADDEKKCKKPIYIEYPSNDLLKNVAFSRAEALAKDLSKPRSEVAIVAFSDELFKDLSDLSLKINKPTEIIKSRGDYEAVSRAQQGGRFILTTPDFIGGLEFSAVVLVGVDKGRFPPVGTSSSESQEFLNYSAHQKLYVAITRAKFRVEVLIEQARGISPTLQSGLEAGLIDKEYP